MKKLRRRKAYQVVIDSGRCSRQVGHKCRLVSRARAYRICKFLQKRGYDARARLFGFINIDPNVRLFD